MKWLAALIAPVAFGVAHAVELDIPVDCEIGQGCYIQSYADRDPGPGAVDYACNPMSYDGHKGVDFRVPTFRALKEGVDILAAAPGVVKGTRNGEPDTGVDGMTKGRDCGNGLVIDHGDGWVTQYCHLERGSLRVRSGDRVQTGDRLGRMGFSGRTEFPHLHLSVRKDDVPIDPFDARANNESCTLNDDASLWSPAARALLTYVPGGAVDAGFAPQAPKLADIRIGDFYEKPTADAPILAFWARFYGLRDGDIIRMRLQRPGGKVLAQKDVTIPGDKAEYFHFLGGRKPTQGWPLGDYHGTAVLLRAGKIIDKIAEKATVK
ncbi:MAG: M23 family metallopeptidase [Pikeienuella sp.]